MIKEWKRGEKDRLGDVRVIRQIEGVRVCANNLGVEIRGKGVKKKERNNQIKGG